MFRWFCPAVLVSRWCGAPENRPMTSMQIRNLYALIAQLAVRSRVIARLDLASKISDQSLEDDLLIFANEPQELDRVARAVEHLAGPGGMTQDELIRMMKELLSVANFYGQLCEFGVYDWLQRHEAAFDPQVHLAGEDVLNPNGTDLDGRFKYRSVFFDIKAMGFQAYVKEQFKKKLQRLVKNGLVTIDGPDDNSVKDIQVHAFQAVPTVAGELNSNGIARIDQLGWTVRLNKGKVAMAESTVDPYRMAEENCYYPFKSARQFARHAPFVLVFAFGHRFNPGLSVNFGNSTLVTLRSLARRAFMQMTGNPTTVDKFDAKTSDRTGGKDRCDLPALRDQKAYHVSSAARGDYRRQVRKQNPSYELFRYNSRSS
jgi:hypothetical protein